MRPLLEDFWYGNINPQEQSTENNPEIKHLLNLMGRNRDSLSDTLTDEQKETLAKYDDCVNEMYGIIEREIFAYAFRLGGQLMLETLKG
jgi:septation ring formation regulator EzrA